MVKRNPGETNMGVSKKWGYPQNTPKWSFLVGKPMVVGYHHFWKHPYGEVPTKQGFLAPFPGGYCEPDFGSPSTGCVVFFGVSWESMLAGANAFWKEACVRNWSEIGATPIPWYTSWKLRNIPFQPSLLSRWFFLETACDIILLQVKWCPFISATFHTGNLHKGEAGS